MNREANAVRVVLRRLMSTAPIAVAAVLAASIALDRAAEVPQVSAAQMEVLSQALADAPSRAAEPAVSVAAVAADIDEPGTPAAAVDYFIKIDGVDGSTSAPGRPGTIEVLSWSWGETRSSAHGSGGGGGAGKVQMQDFHFTMKVNKASPKLMLAVATGERLPSATLVGVRRTDGRQFLEIKLSDLLVSSYQTGASSGDVVPTDQVSLNFTKIEFTVWPELPDGSLDAPVKAGYDLKLNKKV